jgi:PAS domain-containing protein
MSAEAIWILAERPSGEHIAQLYSHETVLVESLRMFTTHGLSRGEAVLLVLTPSHRDTLLHHLIGDGFDVGGLEQDAQLLLLDAAEVLTRFMLDGIPDATLFRMSVGEIVDRMKSRGNRKLRVFGEMVDLLWRSNPPAAVRLEQLWSELIEGSDLSLFCAYSTSHVHESFPEALRTPHSHIITSAMVESSGDAIVGHTLDRRIVYWNRGAESIYGYAPDEVIGQQAQS